MASTPHPPLDDDEPDLLPCHRHPDRMTALACVECDRPICLDCAITAAVGMKCPECGRVSRAARATVPAGRLARGAAAALAIGIGCGALSAALHIPFLGLIIAWFMGIGIGEGTRAASGGFRDPVLGRVAAGAAVIGFCLPATLTWLGLAPSLIAVGGSIWTLIYAAAAAYAAWQRAS